MPQVKEVDLSLLKEEEELRIIKNLAQLPEVVEACADILPDLLAEGALMLDPDPRAPSLMAALGMGDKTPWILIGPEGGFTELEVAAAHDAEARIACISSLALRTTTAALAAAAIALRAGSVSA